ncbi:transglycosylase domain-containing protein [Erysipelothrix sp. Poltava]|nr:transglycosylase domain-containing protein [Erysipelothrix sp. Poltava]
MTNRKSKNEPEIPHMKSGSSNNTNGSQKKAKPKKDKKPLTPEQKKLKRQRIVAWVLIVCVSIGILGVTGVGALTVKNMKNAPALKKDDFLTQSASTIFDKNGEPIYNTAAKKSDPTTFDQVPQSLIDAFVVVEDSRFFVHGGWDVPRFTKAALSNLLDSLRHGSISFGQGGSTLTMQLIKNQYFMENEDAATGVNRKLQEIYLSTKLEREQVLSKKMIFELYINMINYGVPRTMGADASAQAYFGKRLSEINLTEVCIPCRCY